MAKPTNTQADQTTKRFTEEKTSGDLLRCISEVENARTVEALQAAVRVIAEPLGYDRFVLFSASSASEGTIDEVFWVEGNWFDDGTFPDAVTYVRRCPVTRHIFERDEPFFWSKTLSPSGQKYRIVRFPKGRGIHGLQIPIYGYQGLEGAMSLGGERIDSSAIARLSLTLLATIAFRRIQLLLNTKGSEHPKSLPARELEVLRWTAAGRRQKTIAEIMGISERTVENHLRHARIHLGVRTTAQAVQIALRRGQIDT